MFDRLSWAIAVSILSSACLGTPGFFAGQGGGDTSTPVDAGAGGGNGGGSTTSPNGGGSVTSPNGGGFAGSGGFGGSGGSGGSVAGQRPTSRSSTLVVTAQNFRIAVNPDLPDLIVGPMGATQAHAIFDVGSEPSSVAYDAASDTAVVTLRHAQELAVVTHVVSGGPVLVRLVPVCSEPTGVALAPSGATAVVACFGEPLAVIVDVASGVTRLVDLDGVARAVAITNNTTADDTDELAYVTLFYGQATAEGLDDGRLGRVQEISLATLAVTRTITLAPIADTGSGPLLAGGGQGPHVGCSPNQLAAIALFGTYAVVPYICVSPQGPATATSTIFGAVAVLDLAAGAEVRSGTTPAILATFTQPLGPGSQTALADPVDVDIDATSGQVYVLSRGADRVALFSAPPALNVRLLPSDGAPLLSTCAYSACGPSASVTGQPELQGVPVSVAAVPGAAGNEPFFAVNDRTAHALIDDLGGMILFDGYVPTDPMGSPAQTLGAARRFFFTATGPWSLSDRGSCSSCHPDGLSDNVTWIFSAGPRQTPALDGTFASNDATDHRAQNWTANVDEIYDVEAVVRNVLGGTGVLLDGPVGDGGTPISLTTGLVLDGVVTRNDNLSGSTGEVDRELSAVHEWAQVQQFIEQVRSNLAPTRSFPSIVASGRAVFQSTGCTSCHAGPKWTVSHIPYVPSPATNGSAVGDNGSAPFQPTGLRVKARTGQTSPLNHDTLEVDIERLTNPDGGANLAIGPERITCVLRDVGTYDVHDPVEHKSDGSRSQGVLGYNVPSLLGLATSAPYFHHGGATTLNDVFDPRFDAHTYAGGQSSQLTPAQISDLVTFLTSIDETTPTFAIDPMSDLCGTY